MKQQRRTHSPEFKTKVALEALKERKTISEIASEYQVHANQVAAWKSMKYECVYLSEFKDGAELYRVLEEYINFYNNERIHQSLEYQTPAEVYFKKDEPDKPEQVMEQTKAS